jgi:hypothetical protein
MSHLVNLTYSDSKENRNVRRVVIALSASFKSWNLWSCPAVTWALLSPGWTGGVIPHAHTLRRRARAVFLLLNL